MGANTRNGTIWIDVEDLFQYAVANPRPSGVQRLVFEIVRVLPDRARLNSTGPRIAFVRHTRDDALIHEVPFDNVARLFAALSSSETTTPRRAEATRMPVVAAPRAVSIRSLLIRCIQRMPPEISNPLLQAGVLQVAALRYAKSLLTSPVRPTPTQAKATTSARSAPRKRLATQSGDIFLVLGAAWVRPDYGLLLRQLSEQYGLEPWLLLYDLIPSRRPEWCVADLVESFTAWLTATLPQCRRLFAISQATATDVENYAREAGISLDGPVVPVPIGTGFGLAAPREVQTGARPRGLPSPGSYVLFVSTLEARKNHILLFRVWRRLLADLPSDRVPTLVFAGRVGWLVADLMQQLENADWLRGKIRLIRDPSDAELLALYAGCQFTVFPSLFEGWGLPVTESLALGRPCISSNRTSLPEAGGDLARYFDPENLEDAYRAVRAVIDDPADLAAWRERVARDFRHVPWSSTADAILASCLFSGTSHPATEAAQ
jgi:glycosyltransferase involved in cell wall biosynthesis